MALQPAGSQRAPRAAAGSAAQSTRQAAEEELKRILNGPGGSRVVFAKDPFKGLPARRQFRIDGCKVGVTKSMVVVKPPESGYLKYPLTPMLIRVLNLRPGDGPLPY